MYFDVVNFASIIGAAFIIGGATLISFKGFLDLTKD